MFCFQRQQRAPVTFRKLLYIRIACLGLCIHSICGRSGIQSVLFFPFQKPFIRTCQIVALHIPVKFASLIFQLYIIPDFQFIIHKEIQNLHHLAAQHCHCRITVPGWCLADRIRIAEVNQGHNILLCGNLSQGFARLFQPCRRLPIHLGAGTRSVPGLPVLVAG